MNISTHILKEFQLDTASIHPDIDNRKFNINLTVSLGIDSSIEDYRKKLKELSELQLIRSEK